MENFENKNHTKLPCINPNNEIKISENTDVHEAIDFILNLFLNKNYETIIISGLNNAIKKVVLITEIVKSKIPGLHQLNEINCLKKNINEINSNDVNFDTNLNNEKMLPRLSIKLTFIEPSDEEKEKMGYQKPLNAFEASLINKYKNDIYKEDE